MIEVIYIINRILSTNLLLVRLCKRLVPCIGLVCNDLRYTPGCKSSKCKNRGIYSKEDTLKCYQLTLADALNVFEFDFYNEWLNGSLYSFLLKYKKNKSEEKFCGDGDGDGNNNLLNTNVVRINQEESVSVNEGVVVSYKDELFYKPISNANNLMYSTDVYELGSIFDCDWQGFSNAHDDLMPSTYKIPPLTVEDDTIESPIDPLLFDIDCGGVDANTIQSTNIRRLCEIGVGADIDDAVNLRIDNFDINNKLLRSKLIKLNNSNYYGTDLSDITSDFDGSAYGTYRGIKKVNNFTQSFGNSFYFYFGSKPNNTALELMNSKYFTKCTKLFKNVIIINGNVNDVTIVNGGNGSIVINVVGGTQPYTYLWSNGEITKDIADLTEGNYSVTVTDESGRSSKKTFIVRGLQPLVGEVITKNALNASSLTGEVIIKSIIGGIGPYDVTVVGPNTNVTNNNLPYSITIGDLGIGDYTITISDKNGETLTFNKTITVPELLEIINLNSTNPTCFGLANGTLSFNIQGGTPEFALSVNNTTSGEIYTSNNLSNLSDGIYVITVTDSFNQTVTSSNISLVEPNELELTGSGGNVSFGPTISGESYDLYYNDVFVKTVVGNGSTVTTTGDNGSGEYYVTVGGSCFSNTIDI